MQIRNDLSSGKPTTRDEHDHLLYCRMAMLGLDSDAIGRDYREVFDKIKQNCMSCSDSEPCALDLRRDPNNPVWQAYCPNSAVLNALVALIEVIH